MGVLTATDFRHGWAIYGPLVDKNTWKRELVMLPASEKFSRLVCTWFEISIWNLVYITSRHRVRVSSQSGYPDLLYSKKICQSNFSSFMASTIIQTPQTWYTPLHSKCLELCWFSSWLGNCWPLSGYKPSERVSQQSSPPLESFLIFFVYVLKYELEIWYTHPVVGRTHQVSSQSGRCLKKVFQTFS